MKKQLLLAMLLGGITLSAAVPQIGVDLWKENNRYINSHLLVSVYVPFSTATFHNGKEFYGGVILSDGFWGQPVRGTFTRDAANAKTGKGTVTFDSAPGVKVDVQKNGNAVEFAYSAKSAVKQCLYIRLNEPAMKGGILVNGEAKELTDKTIVLGSVKELTIFPNDPARCVTFRFSNDVVARLSAKSGNVHLKPQNGNAITLSIIPGQE